MAIYFIEMEGLNLLKIGFTDRDPLDRLRELQTANPHKLNLLLVMAGGVKHEAQLHRDFAHLQAQGEWFRFTPELQAYVSVARFVFPRLNELEDRVEKMRVQIIDAERGVENVGSDVDDVVDFVSIGLGLNGPSRWTSEIESLRQELYGVYGHPDEIADTAMLANRRHS